MSTESDAQTQAALTANKIASAAVGISIAAFLVAYLQLLLGNLMSGNALWKTNSAAIGAVSRHRSWRPSMRRVKILYPQIRLTVLKLIEAAQMSASDRNRLRFLSRFTNSTEYMWVVPTHADNMTTKHISNGERGIPAFLFHIRTKSFVLTSELDLRERIRYQYWLVHSSGFSSNRPRATWAQIIQAFDITNASALVANKLDTDTIPSGIDVPIQRVKLVDLGQLALALACTKVEIDVESRYFRAVGPYCVMTTEDIPTFGKAVRFEGDVNAIARTYLSMHDTRAWSFAVEMTLGRLTVGFYHKRTQFHLHLLCKSVNEGWPERRYLSESEEIQLSRSLQSSFSLGHLAQEAEALRLLYEKAQHVASPKAEAGDYLGAVDIKALRPTGVEYATSSPRVQHSRSSRKISGKPCVFQDEVSATKIEGSQPMILSQWQRYTTLTVPTVMVLATMAAIPCIFIGFPSGVFLNGIEHWCRFEVQQVLDQEELLDTDTKVAVVSTEAQQHAAGSRFKFLDPTSHALLGVNVGDQYRHAYSWLAGELRDEYISLPLNIKNVLSSKNDANRPASNIKAIILPWTWKLLQSYNPIAWAEDIRRRQRDITEWSIRPCNMLWLQTVLLDIAIRLQISGNTDKLDDFVQCVPEGDRVHGVMGVWGTTLIKEGKSIVNALSDSYYLDGRRLDINEAYEHGGAIIQDTGAANSAPTSPSIRTGNRTPERSIKQQNTIASRPPTFLTASESQLRTLKVATESTPPQEPRTSNAASTNEPTFKPWDLHSALQKHCDFYADMDPKRADLEYGRLAIMLKLRALFFLAFLMVGPDSSQVYEARASHAQVPIL